MNHRFVATLALATGAAALLALTHEPSPGFPSATRAELERRAAGQEYDLVAANSRCSLANEPHNDEGHADRNCPTQPVIGPPEACFACGNTLLAQVINYVGSSGDFAPTGNQNGCGSKFSGFCKNGPPNTCGDLQLNGDCLFEIDTGFKQAPPGDP